MPFKPDFFVLGHFCLGFFFFYIKAFLQSIILHNNFFVMDFFSR